MLQWGGMEKSGFGGRDGKFYQLFNPDNYYSDDLIKYSIALITYIRRCSYIGTGAVSVELWLAL